MQKTTVTEINDDMQEFVIKAQRDAEALSKLRRYLEGVENPPKPGLFKTLQIAYRHGRRRSTTHSTIGRIVRRGMRGIRAFTDMFVFSRGGGEDYTMDHGAMDHVPADFMHGGNHLGHLGNLSSGHLGSNHLGSNHLGSNHLYHPNVQ